jgi:opacity protein-like surface antigen
MARIGLSPSLVATARKGAIMRGHQLMRSIGLAGAAALCLLLMAADAWAQPTWFYVRGDAGASFSRDPGGDLGDDVGTAALLNAGVGFKILPFIRTDLTVTYRTGYEFNATIAGASASGDVTNVTGMLNAYFDFPEVAGRFQPYIAGGIGISYNDADSVSAGGLTFGGASSTDFAWQLGLGVAVSLLPAVAIDLGYRYADLGEVKTDRANGQGLSGNLRTNEVMVGVRVGF